VEQTFAGVRLDPDSNLLLGPDGEVLKLRRQSHDVFVFLMVTRSEIQESVWRDVVVTDDSLQKCIGDIRRLLGANGHEILKTIPRRGFLLQQDVATNKEASSPVSIEQGKVKQGTRWFAQPGKVLAVLAGVGISGFLLAGGIQRYQQRAEQPEGVGQNLSNDKPTLFVENFKTQEADDRLKRLASGLSLDITTELSRNKWLRVHHLEKALDVNQSGSNTEDRFKYLLRGSMKEVGENIKLTAQLIKPVNGQVVWAKSLASNESEFFTMEQSLIEQIGSSIGSGWNGVVARDVLVEARKRPTKNLEAYEALLIGVEHIHRFNPEDSEKGLFQLRRAVELDPEYGEAWAVLAKALMLDKDHASSEEERTQLVEEQKIAAAKSYEFAPYHIDSKLQYSWLMAMGGDYVRTEKYLREAADEAINNPDVLAHIAWAGSERVDLGEDAVHWARRAIDLSEAAPNWYTNALAAAQFNNGDAKAALETLRTAPDDLSRWVYEAVAAAHVGQTKLAQENTRKILEQNPAFRVGSFFEAVPMLDDEVRDRLKSAMLAAGIPQ